MKLFISHATKDKEIVKTIVDDFLYTIGLREDQMFCSSVDEIGVPLKENIYDYIKSTFQAEELYVLFVISEAYYESPACLNEMGAAWIMQSDYACILLPGFKFEEMKGAIDPRRLSISLDSEQAPSLLTELKHDLEKKFNIEHPATERRWERQRERLLNSILEVADFDPYIDISNCRTFCIGDQISRGCTLIEADNVSHKLIVQVDFAKTSQDLCSTVVFPRKNNWTTYAATGKSLAFKIRVKGKEQVPITLELRCEGYAGRPRRTFFAPVTQTTYSFKLLDLAAANTFENVQEICFLADRDMGVQDVEIEISEIKII